MGIVRINDPQSIPDGLKATLDAKQAPPLPVRFSLRSARLAPREERKSESVFGVDLIDRRPFELPLDRRAIMPTLGSPPELRVGFTGLICTPHPPPAVPSICIQYCGFMSLCQRGASAPSRGRRAGWPVVAAYRAELWKPSLGSFRRSLRAANPGGPSWKLSRHAYRFKRFLIRAITDTDEPRNKSARRDRIQSSEFPRLSRARTRSTGFSSSLRE